MLSQYGRVHLIDVPTLIKKNMRGNMYSCKLKDNDRIIWQHMKAEYFCSLLMNKQLYFKQFTTFDKNKDMELGHWRTIESYHSSFDDSRKKIIDNFIDDFSKIVYVSCWYDCEEAELATLAFDKYAKENGVAVGIKVSSLLEALNATNDGVLSYEEFFCGNAMYVDKEGDYVECREAIAPLFLKEKKDHLDSEFRILCTRDSLWKYGVKGMALPDGIDNNYRSISVKIDNLIDLIEYVAIETDTYEKNICFQHALKLNGLTIKSTEKVSGYDLHRIG